jgi:phage-related protein
VAADFDAGSIEGTLDLNNDPFLAGLLKAKAKADEFEHDDITPNLGLDKTKFDAEKDEAEVQLEDLDHKKAEPEVKLGGVAGFLAGLGLVDHEMKKTGGSGESAFMGIGIKMALLIPGVIALAAAMGPLVAVVVGFGVAAGVAFGGVVLSLGLFAFALKSALGPVLAANKAGKDLSGWAGRAQDAIHGLGKVWGQLTASVKPQMFHLIVMALGDLSAILPKLAPLLKVVTEGIGGVVDSIAQVTRTKGFDHFLKQLQQFMGGFLNGLGPVLADALHIFMNLFGALQPLMKQLGHGIVVAADATAQFTKHLKNGGIDGFIGSIEKFLPLLGKLADDTVKGLANLGKGLAPLSGPAIKFIDGLVRAIGSLNLAPLSKGLGDLLDALQPLLPVLANLINKGLALLGPALTIVGKAIQFIGSNTAAASVLIGLATAVGLAVGAYKAWIAVTKLMKAAQTALDIVMDANPIMLVVVAVAALAAGLIYAYTHSKKFREIVNGAFTDVKKIAKSVFNWLTGAVKDTIDFVKNHWQLLLSILTGPIGAAVIFLVTHFSQIKAGFTNLIGDVKGIVSNGVDDVVGFFTSLPGRITALGGRMLNAGQSLMQHIFSGLESAATSVGGFAANIAESIWHELESVLNNILPHSLSIHKGPIHVTVPLFPMLATGGVTNGPMNATIGDNPGGQEAVIPLDKYDLPSKGQTEQIAARAAQANTAIVGLLGQMVALLAKGTDHEAAAEALGKVLSTHSAQQTRAMIQAARAT